MHCSAAALRRGFQARYAKTALFLQSRPCGWTQCARTAPSLRLDTNATTAVLLQSRPCGSNAVRRDGPVPAAGRGTRSRPYSCSPVPAARTPCARTAPSLQLDALREVDPVAATQISTHRSAASPRRRLAAGPEASGRGGRGDLRECQPAVGVGYNDRRAAMVMPRFLPLCRLANAGHWPARVSHLWASDPIHRHAQARQWSAQRRAQAGGSGFAR